MDLSKAFDTINHYLLLAKLKSHGFSKDVLTIMCSYLKNCEQRVVINNSASTTKNDLVLFLQHAILGSYADGNNIPISGSNKENFKKLLLLHFRTLTEWFHNNYMIINPTKCRYICLGKNNNDDDNFSFNEFSRKNSNEETVLGIEIDQKLIFSNYIKIYLQKQVKNCAHF